MATHTVMSLLIIHLLFLLSSLRITSLLIFFFAASLHFR